MMIGMKMEKLAISSFWVSFIVIICDMCIVESNSRVCEKGGCVVEELSKIR